MTFAPSPTMKRRRPLPFRSSFLGLVAFDPLWLLSQELVDETSGVGPEATPLEPVMRDPLPTGGLQVDVEPRRAQLFVDGRLVGLVDQFSGYYHHLELEAGPHVLDFFEPGYRPLTITVVVSPGHTDTYRATLERASGSR